MSAINRSPTFNLKVVVQETGLKPDTLRAWERRYGLPKPRRTSGGHRLYSQRDIDTLKWLVARQDEGLSISRAIDLWHKLEAEGQDPLQVPGYAFSHVTELAPYVPQGENVAELRDAWLAACLSFDEQAAEQVLTQAFALYPPETVCFQLLQKSLALVGQAWYRGKASAQQEHFMSALTMRRLEALVAAAPPPTRPGRILVGCPPEESHTFAPLLLTWLLKRRGRNVVYLGARVPLERFEATIVTVKPHLVILAAQQLHTAASLLEAARLLQQKDVPLAFGGNIFNRLPALRQRISGHFMGEQLETAPQVIEDILTSFRPTPLVQIASEAHQRALDHYRAKHAQVEAELWQHAGSLGIPAAYLELANTELARNIAAALALGDTSFLAADLDWVAGLLSNHQMPQQALSHYLKAYYQAAQAHLGSEGQLVLDWLAQLNGLN